MKRIYIVYYTHFVGVSKKDLAFPLISISESHAIEDFKKNILESFEENLDDYIIKKAIHIGNVSIDTDFGIIFNYSVEFEP